MNESLSVGVFYKNSRRLKLYNFVSVAYWVLESNRSVTVTYLRPVRSHLAPLCHSIDYTPLISWFTRWNMLAWPSMGRRSLSHLSWFVGIDFQTRMHSSRMRAVRSSGRLSGGGGVCLGECLFWGVSAPGGVSALGGVYSQGVSAPRGVSTPGAALEGVSSPGGMSAPGRCLLLGGCVCSRRGIPACTEADTPIPPWTDRRL